MKKVHYLLLFVVSIVLVILIDLQDITTVADLFTLHVVEYFFLLFWAGIFFLLLLPVAMVIHRFIYPHKYFS